MYTETELVRVAKRENNAKRSYLVLNCLQAKHVPAAPQKTIEMFEELAGEVKRAYSNKRLLIIGFAETATAIGAHLAISLDCMLMQTTREPIEGVEYLFFTESHSHATEQKVIRDDLEKILDETDLIIFAEDEVTTGNTIKKIVDLIRVTYPKSKVSFAVASLLNGMDNNALAVYDKADISVHYLVKTNHSKYPDIVEKYSENGTYITEYPEICTYTELKMKGYVNGRRLTSGKNYRNALECLRKQFMETQKFDPQEDYLVIGTEECMYPAIYLGACMGKLGYKVISHSTTRSPIAVSNDEGYPLQCRHALKSLYDEERKTFIYNLKAYDRVYIVTDAGGFSGGLKDLLGALAQSGNKDVRIVRWNEE